MNVTALRWPLAIAGLFALLALAYCQGTQRGKIDQKTVVAKEAVKAADRVAAAAKETVLVHDTTLVRDTLRFTKTLPPLKAIHDTLLTHLTDTLLVKQFVERSDSTVRACSDLLSSCASFRLSAFARFAADSNAIATRDALLKLPVPRAHWGLGLAGGYSCNNRGCGPGLAVGIVWRF